MRVKTLRRVDRWLGVPLCAALTLVRRVSDRLPRRGRPAAPRRVVVVKLAEQGATVLAYPALRHLTETLGRENVFFLVFDENRFILDLLDVIPAANVVPIRTAHLTTALLDCLRALIRLHREGLDSAVDLEFFARSSAVLAYLSGASRRVGFHAFAGEASYRGDLLTHRLSFNPHLHATAVYEMLVRTMALDPAPLPALDLRLSDERAVPTFRATAGEEAEVRDLVATLLPGAQRPRLILLNPNCSDLLPLRMWPAERYVQLARRLLDRYPEAAVLFTGSPAERPLTEGLARAVASERCASVAGRTSLRQLLVLYGLADVLVTNDSGPAHYAALTPIDVVVLFGPETPAAFGPRTPRSHVLWAALPCSPCVNAYNDRQSACRENVCMQRISVDEVFQQTCAVVGARHAVPLQRHGGA